MKKSVYLQDISTKLLSNLGYHGLCEVEFMKDPRDGKMKLLEINARTWKWHRLGKSISFDYPLALFNDLCENVNPDHTEQIDARVSWIHIVTDIFVLFQLLSRNLISIQDYVKSVGTDLIFASFSIKDPIPFISEILFLPYNIVKR